MNSVIDLVRGKLGSQTFFKCSACRIVVVVPVVFALVAEIVVR